MALAVRESSMLCDLLFFLIPVVMVDFLAEASAISFTTACKPASAGANAGRDAVMAAWLLQCAITTRNMVNCTSCLAFIVGRV